MHVSVLLKESVNSLSIREDGIYVDATLGYAGHSSEIVKRIKTGFLFAFDQDQEAISYSEKRLSAISDRYEIIKSNFCMMKQELKKRNIEKLKVVYSKEKAIIHEDNLIGSISFVPSVMGLIIAGEVIKDIISKS